MLRISQVVGLLLVCAIGFGLGQCGPGMFACVQNLYRVQTPAERREVAAKSIAKYAPVTSPKFEEMGEEMRRAWQAEFDAAKKIGESYRMPPPRRP